MLATELATKSRKYFVESYLNPAIEHGYIEMLYPDKPRHPHQKYYLTNDGIMIYKHLKDEAKS